MNRTIYAFTLTMMLSATSFGSTKYTLATGNEDLCGAAITLERLPAANPGLVVTKLENRESATGGTVQVLGDKLVFNRLGIDDRFKIEARRDQTGKTLYLRTREEPAHDASGSGGGTFYAIIAISPDLRQIGVAWEHGISGLPGPTDEKFRVDCNYVNH